MANPRRNGRRPTDDDLLDGARDAFAQHGFRGVSVDLLAAHSGCTKPTLYAHFGDKESVYRRALQREADRVEQHLAAIYDTLVDRPLTDRLRLGVLGLFEYAQTHPAGFELIFGRQAEGPAGEVRASLVQSLEERVEQLFRGYSDSHELNLGASAELLAALTVSTCIEAARFALRQSADLLAVGELTDGFISAALRGIGPDALRRYDQLAD